MKYKYTLQRDKSDTRDFTFSQWISPHSDVVLPRTVDLRPKCPPVYDQGELGSCTSNAGCACRVMLLKDTQVELSRMFLYYMERALEGDTAKDEGASLRDACKSAYKIGICEEKYMPYDVNKFMFPPSRDAIHNAINYRIIAYKLLNNLDEIKQNLAFRQQPVLLGMDTYESFESNETATTGIMTMPRPNEKKLGGHAVLVVGYQDMMKRQGYRYKQGIHTGHLIMRNSWGDQWGDRGYFYMPYSYVIPEYTYDYWIME